jgi:hypothetical protein
MQVLQLLPYRPSSPSPVAFLQETVCLLYRPAAQSVKGLDLCLLMQVEDEPSGPHPKHIYSPSLTVHDLTSLPVRTRRHVSLRFNSHIDMEKTRQPRARRDWVLHG